jgi:hypothetical protein
MCLFFLQVWDFDTGRKIKDIPSEPLCHSQVSCTVSDNYLFHVNITNLLEIAQGMKFQFVDVCLDLDKYCYSIYS